MKNLRSKKFKSITVFLLIVILFFVVQTETVNAFSLFSLSDILSSVVTFPAQVIGYIAGFFTKIVFALGAWLIELALNMNKELLRAGSPVIYGWNIVLNFANLGFVLAIIVIAFATILRLENYAMKKILGRLIVAALLVNFSLVIAGVFISVSDIMTNYFLNATSGGGFTSFSDKFAGMFRAQGFLKVEDVSKGFNESALDGANALANAAGAGIFTIITSLFFAAAFTFISALTLLTIAVMLIIRYVVLGILLILSPIIWLAWIFPATNKWWSEWWNSFLRWTFFPPIMLFFLYLAIYTMESQSYMSAVKSNLVNSEKAAAIGLTFGLDVVADVVIILGLTIGGLIAANKLSLTFASTAYGMAQGAGKWVGGKTWGGVKRGTGGLYNRAIDKFKLKDKSIEASKKAKESGGMEKLWHGLKARTFANLSAPAERAVGKYESEVSKLTMAQAMAQHSTAAGAKWVALNEFLSKNQHKIPPMMRAGKVPVYEDIMEDEMMESDVLDAQGRKIMAPTGRKIKVGQRKIGEKEENVDRTNEWFAANVNGTKAKKSYERYNADFSGVEKRTGMPAEAADAYIAKDLLKFEKAMNKFIVKLKKADAADTGKAWKSVFANPHGDTKRFAEIVAKSVARNNSQIVASLLPHLGGANVVNNFSNIYKQELEGIGMKKELEQFEKTIFNNYKVFEGGAPSSAGTEAPKS